MIETRPKLLQKDIQIINLKIPFGMLKRGARTLVSGRVPIFFSSGSDQTTHVIFGEVWGISLIITCHGQFILDPKPELRVLLGGWRRFNLTRIIGWCHLYFDPLWLEIGDEVKNNRPTTPLFKEDKERCVKTCLWVWKSVPTILLMV